MKRSVAAPGFIAGLLLLFHAPVFCALGQVVEIPTSNPTSSADHVRLVINRHDRVVTIYSGVAPLKTYSVAIGRPGWETPAGTFHVLQMQENPTWKHPLTGEIFRAGDDGNELGQYWIGFSTTSKGAIGFHDTPHPETVGKAVSHGCVRMFKDDIAEIFRQVDVGTLVTVVP